MTDYYVRTAGGGSNTASTYSQDTTLKATGAASGTVPGSGDVVYLESNSGGFTLTGLHTWAGLICQDGYSGTFNFNSNPLTVNGSLRWAAAMTIAGSGAVSVGGTGTVSTITSNGKTWGRALTVNVPSGSVTYADDLNLGALLTHTAGDFVSIGTTFTTTALASTGNGIRSFSCGTSTFNFSGGFTNALNLAGSNISGDFANCTMNFLSSGQTAVTAGIRIGTVNATGTGDFTITPSSSVTHLNRSTLQNGSTLVLGNGLNIYGSLTVVGDATNPIAVRSSAGGTQRDLRAQASGIPVTIEHAHFEDINWTAAAGSSWGTNTISTPTIGDSGGNSFTSAPVSPNSPLTLYLRSNKEWWDTTGAWSTSSGGSADGRIPLPQDSVVIDDNAGTNNGGGTVHVTIGGSHQRLCKDLTVSNTVRRVYLGGSGLIRMIHGSLTVTSDAAGIYALGTNQFRMRPRGTTAAEVDIPGDNVKLPTVHIETFETSSVTFTDGTRLDHSFIDHFGGRLNCVGDVWIGRWVQANNLGNIFDISGAHLRLTGTGTIWSSNSLRQVFVDSSTIVDVTDTSMANKTLSFPTSSNLSAALFQYVVDAPGSTLSLGGSSATANPRVVVHGPGKTVSFGSNLDWNFLEVIGTQDSPATFSASPAGRYIHGTKQIRYCNIVGVWTPNSQTAYDSSDGGSNTGWTFSAGPPPWTPLVTIDDYTDRSYSAVVQEDSPAWYLSADERLVYGIKDRGPGDRTVSIPTVGTTPIRYTDPLISAGSGISMISASEYAFILPVSGSDLTSSRRSYEFWIKTTKTTGVDSIIAADTGSSAKAERVNFDAGSIKAFRYEQIGTASTSASTIVNDGQPHHIVAVFDDIALTVTLWKDGVVADTQSYANVYTNLPTSFEINSARNSRTGFIGTLDELAFYRYALTESQIEEHYDAGTDAVASTMDVELWEAGVFVATLASGVAVTTEEVVSYTFDAALLSDPSGADAEIRLAFTGDVELGAIEWNAEFEAPSFSTFNASVALNAAASLGSFALATQSASITLGAAAGLSTDAIRTTTVAVSLVAPATISSVGTRVTFGATALGAAGSLTVSSSHTFVVSAPLSAPGLLLASGLRTTEAAVSLQAALSLVSTGTRITSAIVVLNSAAALSTTGTRSTSAAVSMNAAPSIQLQGLRLTTGQVALNSITSLSVAATRTTAALVVLNAAGNISIDSVRTTAAISVLNSAAQLITQGTRITASASALNSPAQLVSLPVLTAVAAATLSAVGDLDVDATAFVSFGMNLNAAGNLDVLALAQFILAIELNAPAILMSTVISFVDTRIGVWVGYWYAAPLKCWNPNTLDWQQFPLSYRDPNTNQWVRV